MRQLQRYLQKGNEEVEGTQTPCQGSTRAKKYKMCTRHAVRKADYGNLGEKWEMGQENEGWNVQCAQKMTRRGGAGEGSGSKGC
jgi:hypothetical protein